MYRLFVLSLSNLTMDISSCIPWQYSRTHGLDFPASSTIITGVRGAAGGCQPAAAKSPSTPYIVCDMNNLHGSQIYEPE